MSNSLSPVIIAVVGMPGSGKSETSSYISEKGFSRVRFGDVTEEGLKEKNMPVTPENEEEYRIQMRKDLGMAAYAIRSEQKVKKFLDEGKNVVIDGLYSWEEYLYLKKRFPQLVLLHVFARPEIRYDRLSSRSVRPFTPDESRRRDISEVETLSKGGPIAMADFQITNESDRETLHHNVDRVLTALSFKES